MKSNRIRALTSFAAIASLMPAMCFAEDATLTDAPAGNADTTVTNATSETGATADTADTGEAGATERKRAPAANFLAIVRGRFPLLLVHAVRFDEVLAKIGNKDLAAKLATSVGKIFDIRKGRNFSYLTKDWKPSAADITEARSWAAQIGSQNAKGLVASGDAALIETLVKQYEGGGLATAEELAKFAAAKPRSNFEKKPAEGGAATLPAATQAAAAVTSKAGSADDLLG